MKNLNVVLWGLGSMGSGMAKYLIDKNGIEISGAIAHRESKKGKDLAEFIDKEEETGVKIVNDPLAVINEDVDVVLHSTSSFLTNVYEQLKLIAEQKVNIISIAEEMAYPVAKDKEITRKLDKLAKENGVSMLGTGINPGFVLDLLILTMSGACVKVNKIEASRVNDLSPFGPTVIKTQGVGTTVEEFKKGVKEGTIVGHIGFRESIQMIADRLGWELDEIVEEREPIVSDTHRETPYVKVAPGMVAGCKHIAHGIVNGEKKIILEHPQQIHPEKEGVETGDYIKIDGIPGINLANKPEIPGGIGTMAVAINMIPHIINAEAGLVSMSDLPVPSALMGDVRNMISKRKI